MGQMLSIDHQDGDGKTSLSRAIIKECSFRNERSPHYSKWSVHTDELLLEGANPNIPDNTGFTPLVYACNYGCLDVVNNLLSKGADPNETALRITFQSHLKFSGKILKRLLIDYKGKVDPNILQPTSLCSNPRTYKKLKLLLPRGADPNVSDGVHRTPLYWASRNQRIKSVKLLLLHGANPNMVDGSGGSPLRWAFYHNDPIMIRELLLYGANANTLGLVNGDNLEIVEELKDYFPSLQILSTRSMRKHRVNITKIPPEIYPS